MRYELATNLLSLASRPGFCCSVFWGWRSGVMGGACGGCCGSKFRERGVTGSLESFASCGRGERENMNFACRERRVRCY